MQNHPASMLALKQREISSKYLALEQSGECLSQLERFTRKQLHHKALESQQIDQRELILTMVHSIYLLYSAFCCGCSFRLIKQICVRNIARDTATVYAAYIIEEHYLILPPQLQQYVEKHYEQYQHAGNNTTFQSQFMKIVSTFTAKIVSYSQKHPEFLGKVYKQPFEEFSFVVGQLIRPNLKQITDPHMLLGCIEKTQLFRDNSFLLNVRMSLLYERLRAIIEEGELFSNLKEMQEYFKKDLSKIVTKSGRLKTISSFLSAVLKLLINRNAISIAASIDEQKGKKKTTKEGESQANGKGQLLKANEVFTDRWEFFTKYETLYLNPNNFLSFINAPDPEAFQRTHKAEIKNKVNNYILELDCDREMIMLKILCPMAIGVDNIDSILYQIGTVSEQWYYPSFHLIDTGKPQQVLLTQKRLALGMSFRISPGRSTIARLLSLIDVLLVNQKCFLAELNKPPFKQTNPHKYNLSCQQAQRMNSLLLKNIHKVYEAQMVEEDTIP